MADKFVKTRSDIASSGAAAGDVIYLTEQGEVYDVKDVKTKFVPGNIRISSTLYAVLNPTKTFASEPVRYKDYDTTKAYAKNSCVLKDGVVYMASADIPANTTFAEGTTGATWNKVAASAKGKVILKPTFVDKAYTTFNNSYSLFSFCETSSFGTHTNKVKVTKVKAKFQSSGTSYEVKLATVSGTGSAAVVTGVSDFSVVLTYNSSSQLHEATISSYFEIPAGQRLGIWSQTTGAWTVDKKSSQTGTPVAYSRNANPSGIAVGKTFDGNAANCYFEYEADEL